MNHEAFQGHFEVWHSGCSKKNGVGGVGELNTHLFSMASGEVLIKETLDF